MRRISLVSYRGLNQGRIFSLMKGAPNEDVPYMGIFILQTGQSKVFIELRKSGFSQF
jgi:hypothetical protein